MVQWQTGGAAVHPARQAHAERIYRTPEQVLQGGCARCLLVQRPAPSKDIDPKWIEDYNTRHPHSFIGDMLPREYKNRFGEEFFPETDNINDNFMNLELS